MAAAIEDQPTKTGPGLPGLRSLRKSKGMSLTTLSATANLSVGMLSQIERGLSNPSLGSLLRIAGALGVAAVDLFETRADPGAGAGPLIQRRDDRPKLAFEQLGLTKEILSPAPAGRLELILVTLQPGGVSSDGPYTHEGEEAGLVLDGALELHVAGKLYRLDAGDSFQFRSSLPHCFRNIHPGATRVLWTIAAQGLDPGTGR